MIINDINDLQLIRSAVKLAILETSKQIARTTELEDLELLEGAQIKLSTIWTRLNKHIGKRSAPKQHP